MTSSREWTTRAATTFYEWLVERTDLSLPDLHAICMELMPVAIDPWRLAIAIQWLKLQGMIEVDRRGGQYVIRVVSTQRVYVTRNCSPSPRECAA